MDGCAPLERPWLVWLGQRSYAVYLWHYPLFVIPGPSSLRGVVIALTVPVALAELSWRLVERQRLAPRRALGGRRPPERDLSDAQVVGRTAVEASLLDAPVAAGRRPGVCGADGGVVLRTEGPRSYNVPE